MHNPNTLVAAPANVDQARAWDGADGDYWAEHADRFDRSLAGYQPAFRGAARIEPGDRVLDVGCGTGLTTRAAARQAWSGGAVGIDLSARMIDEARRRAAREGVSNARFEHGDAQIHPFRAGAFDAVISRTGAMFFGDAPAAFGNIAGSLRRGGRLTLLTWQPPARNEWFRGVWTALTGRTELPAPPPGAPGPFSLSDPDRVHTLLDGAGFTDIEITGRTEPLYYGEHPADAERFLLGLVGWMLRDRDDPDRGRADLLASLTDHLSPAGVHYGSACWLVTARRP